MLYGDSLCGYQGVATVIKAMGAGKTSAKEILKQFA